jgi:acetolactate synthase-1/2/3 large subunit
LEDEAVGLILAVGTDLNEWATCGWDTVLMNDKLVHIHDSKGAFARSPMARMHVHGNLRAIFGAMISNLETAEKAGQVTLTSPPHDPKKEVHTYVPSQIEVQALESVQEGSAEAPIKPQRLFREIIERVPPETRFLIDNSNSVPWSIHYFFHARPENYNLSIGFASMGWAMGASVGMALGAPKTPIVCFTGDGCFLMNGLEITVAVREQLPIISVVLNDQAYGMIREGHRLSGNETVDYSIPQVDFAQMAKAVGAEAYTIRNLKDLVQVDFETLCRRNGPTLFDVHIDVEEVPPLGMV